jgi:hypothetical protein
MYDDNEEHQMLTAFLGIKQQEEGTAKPVDYSDLPDELLETLSYFSSAE